jgi:undecaprenyl-diphosphatase
MEDAMTIWAAILLGIIQGVAEFLPISSSGHLSVLQNIFNMQTSGDGHLFFDVLLHLGTLAAVIFAYWRDIADMVREVVQFCRDLKPPRPQENRRHPAGRLALMILVSILPLFLILPVNDYIEQLYYNTFFIGAAFLITGLILFISDRMPRGRKTEKNMRLRDALLIGVSQAIATIPGISRSGTTVTAGIAAGFERDFAVKFSLLMSIPAILGANLLSLVKAIGEGVDASLLPAYLLGMLFAAVTGYFAIRLLQMLMKRGVFGKLAYYCWGAGVVTIILSAIF